LAAIGALIVLFKLWHPKDSFTLEGEHAMETAAAAPVHRDHRHVTAVAEKHRSAGEVFMAWLPYLLLVVFVLLWARPIKAFVDAQTINFAWPGLHNVVQRMPPTVKAPSPYAAMYTLPWLAAPGTAVLIAAL